MEVQEDLTLKTPKKQAVPVALNIVTRSKMPTTASEQKEKSEKVNKKRMYRNIIDPEQPEENTNHKVKKISDFFKQI